MEKQVVVNVDSRQAGFMSEIRRGNSLSESLPESLSVGITFYHLSPFHSSGIHFDGVSIN